MQTKIHDIIIPKENANDDTVKIFEWYFKIGDLVKKNDLIAEIETSKATLDIISDFDGYLEILVDAGTEVEINEVIGRIHNDKSFLSKKDENQFPVSDKHELEDRDETDTNLIISEKAKLLMEKNNISAESFSGIEFIRENDVRLYMEQNKESASKASSKKIEYGLINDLNNSSKSRRKNIFWVIFNYVFRNWFLNLLVKVSPVVIIIFIHRLRGVKIGKGCFIDPSAIIETAYPNYIKIGDDVRIAAGSIIMTHIKGPAKLRSEKITPQVNELVVLKDSCFIGVNCTIMPGVTIGKCAIVASGSVILNDVPDYTMVSGNPAKSIKNFRKKS
jgi:acetyltransferase-like isoleucine patch superfamily enzyme